MKVTVRRGNETHEYEEEKRTRASEFLKRSGAAFSMPCGGMGRCLNCRVTIIGGLSEPADIEKKALGDELLQKGVRLACYTFIEGDCEIVLGEENDVIMSDFETSGTSRPGVLRGGAESVGFAADIGTTTVCGYLYDLKTGEMLSKRAGKNAQGTFGSDVISRIEASLGGNREALCKCVCDQLGDMVFSMCRELKIETKRVKKAVLTGNTAMLYLLTGKDISSISKAPFESETLFGGEYKWNIGIQALRFCEEIYLPKCMGAYVGADITCSSLATDLDRKSGRILMADIGTNGEIVLKHDGKMISCSTAAGPAFEGSGLSCGVTAKEGAISIVKTDGKNISFETIGGAEPLGFCGSGIIDAVAALLDLGMIDETGRIEDDFIIEKDGEDNVRMCGFLISQKDIRAIQMGKAAIRAGIETLLQKEDLKAEDIDEVLIAGGFGSFINVKSACRIGMIPPAFENSAKAVGNAAAKGAAEILLSDENRTRAICIAEKTKVTDLTGDPVFTDLYIENMMFC